MARHVLTLTCPDRPGIVHAVCDALLGIDGNIIENAQFGDPDSGQFCMRTLFETDAGADAITVALDERLEGFGATIALRDESIRPRVLILVSKADHCLVDLCYRWSTGSLPIDVVAVVSNHPDAESVATTYRVPFHHLPVTAETKPAQETEVLGLIERYEADLVVLARYMQILGPDLCAALTGRAINIHHSFLPGFKGARPYHQAYERGVKIIGATAHFVTAELDEGPIIEQDVIRVNHAHTPAQLTRLGQDVERNVLSRAVGLWAEDRILMVGHKTVVFP